MRGRREVMVEDTARLQSRATDNILSDPTHISMRALLFPSVAAAVVSTACVPPRAVVPPDRPLLAVFAHPDDERVIGPLLSRFGREGRNVHLVIATDGSKGIREHAGIPAGPALAAARKLESECAVKRLGVSQLHLVGLEDGGLASFTTLGRLRTELRAIIARVQPAAIITFGPEGGTGHPDHRLVGNVTTELVQGEEHHDAIDLFYATLPAERLRTGPRSSPNVTGVAQDLLTVRVPFEAQDLAAAREAFGCHRTQYTQAEMDPINLTLAHAWNGTVWLRPWNGGRSGIFSR
jgi:LmbE family N-acetylglucosaminyl deacetylase